MDLRDLCILDSLTNIVYTVFATEMLMLWAILEQF